MEYDVGLREKLKNLPQMPGVYSMVDSLGNTIYVGKAKNLKNRVTQYFKYRKDREPKVAEMVRHIDNFTYIVTDTELDALLEECRWIKQLKPRYNRLLKNDCQYCYIKIPDEPYPKIQIAEETNEDGASYYGPFTSRHRVEMAIECFNTFYPIRKCADARFIRRENGCFFEAIGTCSGACAGKVEPDEYKIYIQKIKKFLIAEDLAPVRQVVKTIEKAAANLEFEKAAQYQQYLHGLQHVRSKQQLIRSSNLHQNILTMEWIAPHMPKIFLIKGNQLLYRTVLNFSVMEFSEAARMLKEMLRETLVRTKHQKRQLSQQDIDEAQIIYAYLKKHKNKLISVRIPEYRLKNEENLDCVMATIINSIKNSMEKTAE